MKKFLLPLLALVFSVTAASAQADQSGQMAPPQGGGGYGGTPEQMATRQTERLTQELGLSADQSAKVQQIMLSRSKDMAAMRGQMQGGDRSQMREQMQASRAKYDEQLKQVLTTDQFTKYSTMQANGRGQRGPGGAAPDNTGGKVKEKDGNVKVKVKTDS